MSNDMIHIVLTVLMWILAPIPWIVTTIHVLIKNGKWSSGFIKVIFWVMAVMVWSILGWWFQSNYNVLFETQFPISVSLFFGIIILVLAVFIEAASARALGRKRIFGSSEFEKSHEKLVTTSIYKYARHPRYVEHPLWFIGLGLTFGYVSLIWFALYLFVGLAITAHFEEQELIRRYGKKYSDYKKKTPAFFI